jgi:Flp pilus assembly pilin Flp
MKTIKKLLKEEEGQAVAEYAMLVTLVSLIVVTVFFRLGQSVAETVGMAASAFN